MALFGPPAMSPFAPIGGIADVDVLRLNLLAPDTVEMILDERQPAGLQVEQFRCLLLRNRRFSKCLEVSFG
jgi:hypothetical protein